MNCLNHPDTPAVAYCRACGKALCEGCRRMFDGTIYCEEHLPVPAPAAAPAGPPPGTGYSPYTAPTPPPIPDVGASPGIAFLLGLIPGVGAIYNGQYVKGLVHVIILGILISIVSSGDASGGLEPLFGMMIGVWVFYMAFEAYHTAKKRLAGQPVDEFSSLVSLHGHGSHFPVAPAILIAVGLLFLLQQYGDYPFQSIHPVLANRLDRSGSVHAVRARVVVGSTRRLGAGRGTGGVP